ncbi:hypothetical protein Ani05nite_09450 [Amorphoplanes nipponensis]|uniref:histidine kinase n=1 Tax=Actinoplanes nipponensis TaxID=135950 RepID=A0A919JBN3_9ACTN|nr:histidine kinase [Actinoplanes nipponensis]GIE47411.1 hypothetical protein Ani05nite_09450 [Actinoplanes nipponensis]
MAAAAVAAVAVGLCGAWAYARTGATAGDLGRDLTVGWSFAGAGLIAWWRRPANGTGRLMVLEGITWFLGNFQAGGPALLVGLSAWFEALNLAVLAHLVLAFPEGRLTDRSSRLVARAGYGLVLAGGLLRAITYDPRADAGATYLTCPDCGVNALLVAPAARLFTTVDLTYRALGGALAVACAVLVVRRWRAGTQPRRRALLPAVLSLFFVVVFVVWDIVLRLLFPARAATVPGALLIASDLGQAAVPVAFLVGLLRLRLRRAAVGHLVLEIGPDPSLARLRDALARVLDDPSVQLGLWRPELARYVEPDGGPLPLTPAPGRSVTPVAHRGQRSAVLVHDPALDDDEALLPAVSAALRLMLDNAWLHSEVTERLAEARAASSRLVQAADSERRRLERDLHDGAQVRLLTALMALQRVDVRLRQSDDTMLRDTVAEAGRELRQALTELRELAHGIHPGVLARDGLGPAVVAVAERSALPVVVAVEAVRCPPVIEATAYYTICEALANATKHARARAVTITVRHDAGVLVVEVADDGVGGADLSRGTGLRGLTDRLAAVGGALGVVSPAGAGTRIRAELPCG